MNLKADHYHRMRYRSPEPWTPNGHCRGCGKPLTGRRQRAWCEPWGECQRRFMAECGGPMMRAYVLKRDQHTCQLCGETKGRMEADHIIPISEGGAEFDLKNQRTLCRVCHVHVTHLLRQRLALRWQQGQYALPWPGLEEHLQGLLKEGVSHVR